MRKQTPNILDKVIDGEQTTSTPAQHNTSTPVQHNTSKTVKHHNGKAGSDDKIKGTFYLTAAVMEQLDDAWLSLRKQAQQRSQVSKSAIVEAALQIALDDIQKRGSESQVADKLLNT